MFTIDTIDMQRIAISSIGALVLSAASVVAAVSPAKAAEANAPLTIGDWQADVSRQIDATTKVPSHALRDRDHAIATIAVSFDAAGGIADAKVAKSSGSRSLDREAVRVANAIRYPVLPVGVRGKPQTVSLQIYFGVAGDAREAARHAKAVEALARGGDRTQKDTQIAALPTG